MDLKNIVKLFRITKPNKMGKKLLILATAPEVKIYFEDQRVREYFKEYDVAMLNKMPLCSEEEMHIIRPKYIIFFDGIFFDRLDEDGKPNERREWVEDVFSRIDWECNIVIPVLAKYNVHNPNLKYIYIGVFSLKYNCMTRALYRRNLVNMGFNNVVMGAVYYGITFGYEEIAILGFTYGNVNSRAPYMEEDGLHVEGYPHYYDEDTHPSVVPPEKLFDGRISYSYKRALREVSSTYKLCELARYANDNKVEIINFTPNNRVDVFRTKDLNKLIN